MNDYVLAMDHEIKAQLAKQLKRIENTLESDVVFFHSDIYPGEENFYRDLIEAIPNKRQKLTIILTTPGGDVVTVEKLVNINRHFYKEVNFLIPDMAMSAGTVFCLSGDSIMMEYTSSLGPIDPQVYSDKQKRWVAAAGYIDEMKDAIEKSRNGTLTNVEYLLVRELDFAFLKFCEQQMILTVQLIKDWLVQYKFKNWTTHSSTGQPVTISEKEQRAEEIANKLNDSKIWLSHGRFIGIDKLKKILHLKVEDYSQNPKLLKEIRMYNALAQSYITRNNFLRFFQTRNYV